MTYRIGNHTLHTYPMPLMNSNMYVLTSDDKAMIVDPCINEDAERLLAGSGVKELTVILTHEHYDHISGVNRLRDWLSSVPENRGCKVYASKACSIAIQKPTENLAEYFMAMMIKRSSEEQELAQKVFDRSYSCTADVTFEDTFELKWEDLKIVLVETPGHSPGSICAEIYETGKDRKPAALVTGDSLVYGNRIITRLPGGDRQKYREITRPYLEGFDRDTMILPGHGSIASLEEFEIV